jgi:hypothetical protein
LGKEVPIVIDNFSGGIVTDIELGETKTLLQGKNIVLNVGGPFEKRKGSELLSSAGISLNSESDIYSFIVYAHDPTLEGTNCDTYNVYYAGEKTEGARTYFMKIDYGSGTAALAAALAFYNAWVAAATAGSYLTNYDYGSASVENPDCGDPQ